jgi:hypothetical protein
MDDEGEDSNMVAVVVLIVLVLLFAVFFRDPILNLFNQFLCSVK